METKRLTTEENAIPKSFFLRTPVYPLENINNIPSNLLDFFYSIIKEKYFMEAIYVASEQLYETIERIKKGEISGNQEILRVAESVFKYWIRMSTRCTPFGMFSGCAIGNINNYTDLTIDIADEAVN